jgi:anion-transporting  ArsA/GET3 family ATPase
MEGGDILTALGERQLVVVTGKGGVGKTTLSVVLGRLLAARGKSVLVLEVDPRESAHQLLGVPPSGGEAQRVAHGLFLQNLRPRQVLDRLVEEQLRVPLLARRVLASPVYHQFAEGAPGLRELAVLGHALRLLRGDTEPAVEVVVLDAPATGHGVSLLMAPRLVSETIRTGPFGSMAADLARFIGDPEVCAVVAASHAEEMAVQETLELVSALESELGRAPVLVALNAQYPPLPESTSGADDPLTRLWRERRGVNDRERARLRVAWKGTLLDLPLLPLDRGPELVEALTHETEERLQSEEVLT